MFKKILIIFSFVGQFCFGQASEEAMKKAAAKAAREAKKKAKVCS